MALIAENARNDQDMEDVLPFWPLRRAGIRKIAALGKKWDEKMVWESILRFRVGQMACLMAVFGGAVGEIEGAARAV